MTHYIKHTYLMLYPQWDITQPGHPHYVSTSVTIPINTHVSSMSLVVSIKTKYIHNKVYHHIRQQSHADEVREFLMQKYKWSTTTVNSIDWETQRNIIKKLHHALQRTSLRFIHHRFPTGKMQFDIKHRCLY